MNIKQKTLLSYAIFAEQCKYCTIYANVVCACVCMCAYQCIRVCVCD